MLTSLLNSPKTPSAIPAPEVREEITALLSALVEALEHHPAWSPPNTPKNLFHIWDFVKRSHYIMTELDNIQNGQPTKHPEQIPRNEGATGAHAAALSFQDVCTRTITADEMIQKPTMLVMLGLSQIDFGDSVRQRSKALSDAVGKACSSS